MGSQAFAQIGDIGNGNIGIVNGNLNALLSPLSPLAPTPLLELPGFPTGLANGLNNQAILNGAGLANGLNNPAILNGIDNIGMLNGTGNNNGNNNVGMNLGNGIPNGNGIGNNNR